jgi:hypothetical protein
MTAEAHAACRISRTPRPGFPVDFTGYRYYHQIDRSRGVDGREHSQS